MMTTTTTMMMMMMMRRMRMMMTMTATTMMMMMIVNNKNITENCTEVTWMSVSLNGVAACFTSLLMAFGCIWNNGTICKTSVLNSPAHPSSTTNSLDLLACYI